MEFVMVNPVYKMSWYLSWKQITIWTLYASIISVKGGKKLDK